MIMELAVLSTFRCAQEVYKLNAEESPALISQRGIVYFLTGSQPEKRRLVVLNEVTVAVFKWPENQLKEKVRFTFGSADPRGPNSTFYLIVGSNTLIGIRRHQLFPEAPPSEYAPSDFEELDYLPTPTSEALNLASDKIQSEIKSIHQQFRSGKLMRQDLLKGNLALCRFNPDLKSARLIRSYVDELLWVSTPLAGDRSPAGF